MFVGNKMTMHSFGTQQVMPVLLPAGLRQRFILSSLVNDDLSVFDNSSDSSIKNLILEMGLKSVDVGVLYIGEKDIAASWGGDSRRVAHAILDIADWIVTQRICRTVIVFVRTPKGSHKLSRLALSVMELSCTRNIPSAVVVKAIPNVWSRRSCFDASCILTPAGRSAAAVITARVLGLLPPRRRTRPALTASVADSESKKPDVKRLLPLEFGSLDGPAKRVKQEHRNAQTSE